MHSLQLECVGGRLSNDQVSYVDWIEGPAKYSDSHRNSDDDVSLAHGSALAITSG